MKPPFSCLVIKSIIVLIVAGAEAISAQGLSFSPPVEAADGSIEIRLQGEPGAELRIEASTNLLEWSVVASGAATNGVLSYRQGSVQPVPRAMYFRGRSTTLMSPILLTPRADTNFAASGLATLSGSTVVLNGTNFIRFTLNVPSNSVPETAVLNLKYVTNLSGLPFAGRLIGAVQIEPTNVVFWRAAALEITYPTNIDRRRIVSFACEPDGTAFRLMIDRVYTNRVVIPIARGGIYGSVVATEQEILALRGRVSPPPAEMRAASTVSLASVPEDCEPAEKARAKAIRRQIETARYWMSHDLALIIGVQRQRQILGVDDPSLLEQANEAICQFYRSHVEPHWPDAASNCALSKVLLQFTYNLERQRQLLGATDNCIPISTLPLCPLMKNCLKEIRDCCDRGFKGPPKITEVLTLQRQDQLMGLDCISNAEAQEVIDRCATNVWTGTFSARETANYFFSTNQNGALVIRMRQIAISFEGAVVQSQETGTLEFGFSIQLMVEGQLDVSDFESESVDIQSRCLNGNTSSGYTLQETHLAGTGKALYIVMINTQPNGNLTMFAGNQPTTNNTIGIPAIQTFVNLRQSTDCDGGQFTQSRVTHESQIEIGPQMPLHQDQLPEPNPTTFSGSSTAEDANGEITRNFTFRWDFARRTGPF